MTLSGYCFGVGNPHSTPLADKESKFGKLRYLHATALLGKYMVCCMALKASSRNARGVFIRLVFFFCKLGAWAQ